ncbi:hypothetical protein ACIRCZ_12245, partial [Leifsonia sp. NPDC102414]
MNKYVSRGLWFTLFLGGLSLAGVGVANAAETSGSDGTASGTQAVVDLTVPVTISGNGISVLGDSSSADATAAAPAAAAPAAAPAPSASVDTYGLGGVLSGTQALVDVNVPVTVTGNSISAVGDAATADSTSAAAPAPAAAAPAASGPTTSGSDGVASGTQAPVDAAVPVTVGGNAISVLGDSTSTGSTATAPAAGTPAGSGATTTGADGIASGIQAPIGAAV